jgi:hypothetical protein
LVEENVAAGLKAFFECLRRGIPAFCPQLTGAFPSAFTAVDYDTWIEYNFAVIRRCTHLVLLPRWERSRGAVLEKEFADSIDMPVVDWHDLYTI